ncbi:unnamed protein product [Dovyalis caffra]|uniref:Uncharacterized protein n=1 Tax=Dovyalis caffra TaxID=77055 RepID=A0AAV1RYC2_9ROSI|nr:unnamed protein product [Dovyalis caffra]
MLFIESVAQLQKGSQEHFEWAADKSLIFTNFRLVSEEQEWHIKKRSICPPISNKFIEAAAQQLTTMSLIEHARTEIGQQETCSGCCWHGNHGGPNEYRRAVERSYCWQHNRLDGAYLFNNLLLAKDHSWKVWRLNLASLAACKVDTPSHAHIENIHVTFAPHTSWNFLQRAGFHDRSAKQENLNLVRYLQHAIIGEPVKNDIDGHRYHSK